MKRYPHPKLMMFVLALILGLLVVAPGRLAKMSVLSASRSTASPTCTMNPVVTNDGNSGGGTLRQAVIDACPDSTITFDMPRTIPLASGQIVIDKNLTIQGPGANLLVIQNTAASSATSRVFVVNAGVTATISGLTITGGNSSDVGGGIYNQGTLTVANSTVANNTAAGANQFGLNALGGGIYNEGTLTLTNSTILNNSAVVGGGIYNFPGRIVTVTNSTITNNLGGGGGIYNSFTGAVMVTNSTIASNSTTNGSSDGGGLYNEGTLNVTHSTVANNRARNGSGIYNHGGAATITNSTVSNNTAAYFQNTQGGGIYNDLNGAVTLTNSTVSNNQKEGFALVGGIYNQGAANIVNCRNTIIAGNSAFDFFGTMTSQGYNLIGNTNLTTIVGDTTGNILNQNPLLGPLQNNGGPTQTQALLPGSPAIDKGAEANNPVTMNPIIADQRNYTRPFDNPSIPNAAGGNGSDIGAYEADSSPTAVKLGAVKVTAQDGGVFIEWDTGFEVNNLGFNLYREVDGQRTRITAQLIAGSALTDGPGTSLLAGHRYFWADSPPKGKAISYWLEDLDLDGTSTLSGPYYVNYAQPSTAAAAQRRSALISQIGIEQGLMANGLNSAPLARAATLATPTTVTLPLQSDLDSKPAVKIAVKQEGFFRVTQSELLRAGLDPISDPRRLQLFADGVEQPVSITGEQDGSFDPQDAVEFYGVGLDTPSTDTRVYWLVEGWQPGKRIPNVKNSGGRMATGGFPFTVERKDRTIYFSALRNGEAENFFGAVIASQPVDQTLRLQHLNQLSSEPATVEIALQGVTATSHDVRVQLNGTDITRIESTGQALGKKLVSISQSLLREGENTVRLIAEGGPGDVSLVDAIRITYSHNYVADAGALRLTAQAGEQVTIAGFTTGDIRLLDVTDAGAVQEIATTVTSGKNGYQVSSGVGGTGTRELLAVSGSQLKSPASVSLNQPSRWRQSAGGADLLIITRREFLSAIEPLKALRQSQGLSVAVVDIEDVYDEFSFGNKSPGSLRDFISYAATAWKKKPRYVLLAGDASYDPRNHLGLGDFDDVPTKLIDTTFMEAASDDWLADLAGDGVAELAVGRLPFRNLAEAAAMIAKIIGYERSSPSEEVTLVADANDGFDFEQASAQLMATLPPNLKVNRINRGQTGTTIAKEQLLAAVGRGQKVINYAGHGSVNQWRGNLLANEDAAQMNNVNLTLFVMMTCLNGYFDDPALGSLSESLLKAERGGAVAVWASTGMTTPSDQAVMNQELYRQVLGNRSTRLGDAARAAKAAITDADVRRTWVLLGDPTMRLR